MQHPQKKLPLRNFLTTCFFFFSVTPIISCGEGGVRSSASMMVPTRYFTTRLAGTTLPSSSNCAQWVRQSSTGSEIRPLNTPYNETVGRYLHLPFFSTSTAAYDQRANSVIAARVDGQFTGTTEDILRWGACKWGFDENIVKAMAANESWWKQTLHNNWTTQCPSSHPAGSDSDLQPLMCHRDYGLLQLNYDYNSSAWPEAETSSAMNVDVALSIVRACYEGYNHWIAKSNPSYKKGDVWGCLGAYNSGKWYDSQAQQYIHDIQKYKNRQVWQRFYF
jgi:autotransporter family porin